MSLGNAGDAKYDPGWNDPPLFSYEAQTAQSKSTKPRTYLTKRVAFPMQGASPPTSNYMPVDPTAPLPVCNIANLPPPPTASANPPREVTTKIEAVQHDDVVFDPSQAFEAIMSSLCDVLNTKFENEEKDKAEIQRRIDTLRKMWIDSKLCKDVQQKIFDLSQALKNNDTGKADDIQKGLMVDHAPSCSPWMSGVRQLIHHKGSKGETLPISDPETAVISQDPPGVL